MIAEQPKIAPMQDVHADQKSVGKNRAKRVRQYAEVENVRVSCWRCFSGANIFAREETQAKAILRNQYVAVGCKNPSPSTPSQRQPLGDIRTKTGSGCSGVDQTIDDLDLTAVGCGKRGKDGDGKD